MRYIIGDIHGCSSELQALIDLILKSDLEADFYSVGDVVNKGPDSLSCLEILEKHQVTVIRGNHEDWLVRIWETFLAELEEFDISRQSCMSSQCGGLIAMFKIESLLFESSVMNDFNAQTSLYSKDFQRKIKSCKNPYGTGGASTKILKILKKKDLKNILIKKFYDL